MSSSDHAAVTSSAEDYLASPRKKWPLREDEYCDDNLLLKLNWGKGRGALFDVAVKDSAGSVKYARSRTGSLIQPGHEVMFKASLPAFIPDGAGDGATFSVSYTVRGLTLLRRAAKPDVIKLDAYSVDFDAEDVNLTPLQ